MPLLAIARKPLMGRLTTHVLDTRSGRPAGGLRIDLFRVRGEARTGLKTVTTNDDGRVDRPLLEAGAFEVGVYELMFHAGDYYRHRGVDLPDPPFLDRINIRFGVNDAAAHYHVPLLMTPWSYSTYRGS